MAAKLRFIIEALDRSNQGIGSAEGGLEGLADTAKKVGLALGAAFAVKQAADIAKVGAVVERQGERLEAFAADVGGAEAAIEAFKAGAGGAVGDLTAMTEASRLLQMGIVDSTKEMEFTVEAATRLGDQTQSVAQRTQDWALMMANTSIPRLDAYGLSAGKARSRINELMASTKDMSREQAFAIAVQEQATDALGKLGPRVEDNLSAFEKFDAEMENLTVTAGTALVPVMSSLVGIASDVLGAVQPLITAFGNLDSGTQTAVLGLTGATVAAANLAGGFVPLAGQALQVARGVQLMSSTMGAGASAMQVATASAAGFVATAGLVAVALGAVVLAGKEVVEFAGRFEDGMETVSDATEKQSDELQELMDAGASTGEALGVLAEKTNKVTAELNNADGPLDAVAKGLVKASKGTEIYSGLAEEAQEVALAGADSYGEYTEAIEEYNASVTAAAARVEVLTEAQWRSNEAVGAVSALDTGYYSDMAEMAAANAEVQNRQTLALQQTRQAALDHAEELQNLSDEQQGFTEVLDNSLPVYDAASSIYFSTVVPAMEAGAQKSHELRVAQEGAAVIAGTLAAREEALAAKTMALAANFDNLAQSLMGATDAQIANTLTGMLDPEQMGAEAFMAAATDIGMTFGTMDEKSVALAQSLPTLADSLNNQVVPAENAAEALQALITNAEEGDAAVGSVISTFDRFPESGTTATQSAADVAESFEDLGSAGDVTMTSLDNVTTSTSAMVGPMSEATQAANALEAQLLALSQVPAPAAPEMATPGPNVPAAHMQHGGVVPGPIGQPVLIQAHGGEIVSNPYQVGAVGGPGGPRVTNHFGG